MEDYLVKTQGIRERLALSGTQVASIFGVVLFDLTVRRGLIRDQLEALAQKFPVVRFMAILCPSS